MPSTWWANFWDRTMKFEQRANTEMSSINEWQAGNYAIVELAFTFGQHRIQI